MKNYHTNEIGEGIYTRNLEHKEEVFLTKVTLAIMVNLAIIIAAAFILVAQFSGLVDYLISLI